MDSSIAVGEMIAGKYRVERVVGTGGMGVVVAATHVALHELRAIKLMRPKLATNAAYCERFLHEAQAIARLKGEHVAKVHDVGTLDGVPYMVIEYVEGTDFAALIRDHGPTLPQEAVLYALQICEALAEAHRQGVVHRDIKPANLFLAKSNDGSPCVKVIDFGIAKTAADLTLVGVVLGSPRYMPPEQIRATREVDARADIWALGVVLYELCTGQTPFEASSVIEICERIFEDPVVAPSKLRADVPAGLDAVILRCLEKDRDDRYANVADLAEALGPFGTDEARSLPARVARVLGALDRDVSPSASPGSSQHPRAGDAHTTEPDAKMTAGAVSTAIGPTTDPFERPLPSERPPPGVVTETAMGVPAAQPPKEPAPAVARVGLRKGSIAAIGAVSLAIAAWVLGASLGWSGRSHATATQCQMLPRIDYRFERASPSVEGPPFAAAPVPSAPAAAAPPDPSSRSLPSRPPLKPAAAASAPRAASSTPPPPSRNNF